MRLGWKVWRTGAAGRQPLAALSRAFNELGAAQMAVEDCISDMAFNPSELEQVEERSRAIRGLARKHGVLADDLALFADGLRGKLAASDGGEADLKALADVSRVQADYDQLAVDLSEKRNEAGRSDGVELPTLKMERAFLLRTSRGSRARTSRWSGAHGGDEPRRAVGAAEQDRLWWRA